MWRLWTRGWGPRSWWYWWRTEGWPMFVVWKILTPRLCYWAFIRVYALGGQGPGPEFKEVCDRWEAKYGIR